MADPFNKQSDKSPLITKQAKLSFFKVSINNIELRQNDIIDIQINFGDNGKKGIITYSDTMNLNEIAPVVDGLVYIQYHDYLEGTYSEHFAITKVEVVRLKKNIISTVLYFEDLVINKLKKTFLSKAYSNVTFTDVIIDLMNTIDVPAQVAKTANEKVFENFVVPKNMSTYDFLMKQMPLLSVVMYSGKQGMVFTVKDVLDFANFDVSAEPTFTLGSEKTKIYWSILEYGGTVSNPNGLLKAPVTTVEYKQEGLCQLETVETSISSVYPSQELNGAYGVEDSTIVNSTITFGQKTVSALYDNEKKGIDVDYRDVINDSQEIMIAVHGLNIDRLYTKINIEIPRPAFIKDTANDEVFSGSFIVTAYIDKIISGNFIQHLILKRSDYKKGSLDV